MSLQDVEALGYAVITNMRGCAGDKAIHLLGIPAAERAGERWPEQTSDERQRCLRPQAEVDHVRTSLSTIRPAKALRRQARRGKSAINLKVCSQRARRPPPQDGHPGGKIWCIARHYTPYPL